MVDLYNVNRNEVIRACELEGRLGGLRVNYVLWGDLPGEEWNRLVLDGDLTAYEISDAGRHRDVPDDGGDVGPPLAPSWSAVLMIGSKPYRLVDLVLDMYGDDGRLEGTHAELLNGTSCAVDNLCWSATIVKSR
eukprot:TRINITY_DN924_c0_g1_i6.p3 TRINITY_DN924_c0_g1~~TRINITY_DN924_c0_g1_i6.p3  ORF type:complete len:134 (-),score=25.58 TRINITY_DN924_c0_g1_i6:265-666(-)